MRLRNILAIAQKDWIEVRGNKYAWAPMLMVPVLFVVILPLIIILLLTYFRVNPDSMISGADLNAFYRSMPASIRQYLDSSQPIQFAIITILGFMFAPMFLMLPLMYSTTIAAESFAGERERQTMEALLYTPATDGELFLGKVIAAAVPSISVTWLGFFIYSLILNLVPYTEFQRVWFPLPTWWPLIFWMSPALVMLGISFTVLVSARVPNFQGAYQTSSAIVILIVVLFIGQLSGVLYLSITTGVGLGAILWIIAAVLSWYAVHSFNRDKMIMG